VKIPSLAELSLLMLAGCALGEAAVIAQVPPDGGISSPLGDDGAALGEAAGGSDDGPPFDAGSPGDDGPSDSGSNPEVAGGVALPSPGDVFISEVMVLPSGTLPDDQWIELYNSTVETKLLSGLTLTDGHGTTRTISTSPPVTIAPASFVLLARNKSAVVAAGVPATAIVYDYGQGDSRTQGILLSRHAADGGISLSNGASVLANIPYGPWINGGALASVPPAGASIELKSLTTTGIEMPASWCVAQTPWAGHDKGTPGTANDCP
jgi:hypothetical protein